MCDVVVVVVGSSCHNVAGADAGLQSQCGGQGLGFIRCVLGTRHLAGTSSRAVSKAPPSTG